MPNTQSDPYSLIVAAQALRNGQLSPLDLLDSCLARIDALDPQIQAWVVLDRDGARQQARQAQQELATGLDRGPLHGIPIGIKDIVDVAGFPTLAGSSLRADHVASGHAPLVAQLRTAGAVLLGKTVTTQWASFDPPITRNPWNLDCTPAGSSSGSAAAVAAHMCFAAVGSQTGGSITRPASYCGVAGLKPTYGRVSCQGILPLAPSMDHPGPIARTVTDLAAMFAVMLALQADDPLTRAPIPTAESLTNPEPPRLARLTGWLDSDADPDVRQVTAQALDTLRAAGAVIQDVSLPSSFAHVHRRHRVIMAVEAAAVHRDNYPAHRNTFGPQISSLLDEGRRASPLDYAHALMARETFRRDVLSLLEGFDALVMPSTTSTAPPLADNHTGDPKFNSLWSYSGFPTVTLPSGLADNGLPVGLQLIGRPWQEPALLLASGWCEQQLHLTLAPPLLAP
jgi:aspartyl-tRNA(Asn)/glutamyl-tRNA(Gln) amidotransferase subunit A